MTCKNWLKLYHHVSCNNFWFIVDKIWNLEVMRCWYIWNPYHPRICQAEFISEFRLHKLHNHSPLPIQVGIGTTTLICNRRLGDPCIDSKVWMLCLTLVSSQRELAAKIVPKMLFQQLIFHIFTSLFLNEDIFLCMGIEDTQGIYNNSRFSTSWTRLP